MKGIVKSNISILIFILLVSIFGYLFYSYQPKEPVHLLYLKEKVLEFAEKHRFQPVIVVSKSDHLLFYSRDGKIVENDHWNGFNYNFPVKVALASKFFHTPEGEMFIESKNAQSRYILFLKLSYPGEYGIHSAPTRWASFLEIMERLNPNYSFATEKDDTRGCVAVENRVIKYLFAKVDVKTPVLIMP